MGRRLITRYCHPDSSQLTLCSAEGVSLKKGPLPCCRLFFVFPVFNLFLTQLKKILGCVLFAIKTPDRPRYEREGIKDYILRGE